MLGLAMNVSVLASLGTVFWDAVVRAV